jgi:hypothetical protein
VHHERVHQTLHCVWAYISVLVIIMEGFTTRATM